MFNADNVEIQLITILRFVLFELTSYKLYLK